MVGGSGESAAGEKEAAVLRVGISPRPRLRGEVGTLRRCAASSGAVRARGTIRGSGLVESRPHTHPLPASGARELAQQSHHGLSKARFNFQTANTISDTTPHSRGATRPSRA